MARKHFGTDGVRGVANAKLTPEFAVSLGLALGQFLRENNLPMLAVVGRDTRQSGPMLSAALCAGLTSAGVTTWDLGVAPTPAVSFVTRTQSASVGIVVSASHNPAPDNGLKLINSEGRKFTDEAEERIEALMETPYTDRPTGGEVGAYLQRPELLEHYLDFLCRLVPEGLSGLKIAVDAAHGAAYQLGPEVFRRLGATVVSLGTEPNGTNINHGVGATEPQTVQDFTVNNQCDFGVAFDGDADRAVFSDDQGHLLNGDRTLGIWAVHQQQSGALNPPIIVGTVMSNMGFEKYLESQGVTLERTPVGDKYVSQKLAETGARAGGEQSGHIVFPANGPTGDGLATALEIARVLKVQGRKSSEFYNDYEAYPQLLVNISLSDRESWKSDDQVQGAIQSGEQQLGDNGRINVRASGTQPMVRVMVEANSFEVRDQIADTIVTAFLNGGGKIYSKVDLTHALGD